MLVRFKGIELMGIQYDKYHHTERQSTQAEIDKIQKNITDRISQWNSTPSSPENDWMNMREVSDPSRNIKAVSIKNPVTDKHPKGEVGATYHFILTNDEKGNDVKFYNQIVSMINTVPSSIYEVMRVFANRRNPKSYSNPPEALVEYLDNLFSFSHEFEEWLVRRGLENRTDKKPEQLDQ